MARSDEKSSGDIVEVGKIVGVHGVSGELKILSYGDGTECLGLAELTLKVENSEKSYRVDEARPHKGVLLVKLSGVKTKEAAKELVGGLVMIPRSNLPKPEPGEYYHIDLIGLRVVTEDGLELGRLTDIITTGANDVYEIVGDDKELLLPAIEDVIVNVDIEGRTMTVRLMEGMLAGEAGGGKKGRGE